jgi:Protein of unknown function (DUF998)
VNQTIMTRDAPVSDISCAPATRMTKSLLGYGVIAGPLYVVVVLAQSLTRPGFDLTRDDASLLSNGSLGWIQIANFAITGVMVIACAIGIQRALQSGIASTWAPRLIGLYGLGLVAAGIFVADPMNGFPPGTPAGRPSMVSVHGTLHIAAAVIGFLCLIAACLVLARRFSSLGQQRWAVFSRATGVLFLLGFVGVASGSSSSVVVLGFWIALLVVWGWLAAVSIHLYRQVTAAQPDTRPLA